MEARTDIEKTPAGSSKEAPEKRHAPPHLIRKTPPEQGDRRYGRSRITNGTALLPGIDGRSPWVRRCKDIIASHLSDLGGVDNTSAAERSIIRRASVLTVELERLEAKFAVANEASNADLELYQRTAGNLRRLLEAVGITRRPRDVTPPDPLDYARDHTHDDGEAS